MKRFILTLIIVAIIGCTTDDPSTSTIEEGMSGCAGEGGSWACCIEGPSGSACCWVSIDGYGGCS